MQPANLSTGRAGDNGRTALYLVDTGKISENGFVSKETDLVHPMCVLALDREPALYLHHVSVGAVYRGIILHYKTIC